MQIYWLHIKKIFTNKYAITLMVFIIYLIFFQQYNWLDQLTYKKERDALKQKKDYYQTEIKNIDQQTEAIKNDKAALEKYAREQYLMKKENEIIIITEP